MNLIRISPLILAGFLFAGAGLVSAQGLDVYGGAGTAMTESTGVPVDTFGTGTLYTPPRMGGTFLKFGGDSMLTRHYGIGAETSFRVSQGSYAGLKYRPTFYDFNGIWHPTAGRRIVPELQGGIGGVNMKFYYSQQSCDQFAGCSTQSQFLESSNHFQVHMSAGVKFFVRGNFFVKPQVDAHWVNNFFQFGSNWVPEYSGVIGYSFGEH